MIRAIDIHNRLRERGDWVNWEQTTDTFKAGDPDKPVRTVAVAWKPTWDALKEAHSRGADQFVGHESICVNAVNHGVAKEWGIGNLATYLGKAFPSLRVFHIPQRCPYVVVGGGETCHT